VSRDGNKDSQDAAERLKETAARLRNILDQKTWHEKRVLKKYLLELERRLGRSKG
jgi:hypothetical protein